MRNSASYMNDQPDDLSIYMRSCHFMFGAIVIIDCVPYPFSIIHKEFLIYIYEPYGRHKKSVTQLFALTCVQQ